MVTDPNAADVNDGGERHPPSLTLANSVLTILREPLPSDEASLSNAGPHVKGTSPPSRVRARVAYCSCGVLGHYPVVRVRGIYSH